MPSRPRASRREPAPSIRTSIFEEHISYGFNRRLMARFEDDGVINRADGKTVHNSLYHDQMGMLVQLGLLPGA